MLLQIDNRLVIDFDDLQRQLRTWQQVLGQDSHSRADLQRLMPGKGSDYVLCNALVSQKMLPERLFRTYFHRGKDTEYSSIL